MKPDRTIFEKAVHRHLSLLGSPSVNQVEISRARTLQGLRARYAAAQSDAPPAVVNRRYAWRVGLSVAAAAAVVVIAATVPFQRGEWLATVEAADGSRYTLEPNEVVRSSAAGGAMLRLVDGSSVEMRAASELSLERAADGLDIHLRGGDIIVTAAGRRGGQLYVRTKDMTASVAGTIALVNVADDGSRVAVIQGEARVRERGTPLRRSGRPGATETRVRPGEQLATSPVLAARPVRDDIIWSRNATVHRAVIDSFMKGVAQSAAPLTPLARQADVTGVQAAGTAAVAMEFEEASIRPCDPDNLPAAVPGARGGGGSNSFYMTPGRFYALCMTPATLIRSAYGYRSVDQEVELGFTSPQAPGRMLPIGAGSVYNAPAEDGRRVRGGPDWLRTEKYTIEAVAGSAAGDAASMTLLPGVPPFKQPDAVRANAATMSGPMLRALLERRFGLKAHIETEQSPAYSLVVAPGGLKMKEGACTNDTPRPRGMDETGWARWLLDVVRRNLNAARRGDATTGVCGPGIAANGPNRIFVGAGIGLPPLLETLGAPVFNRTGIPDTRRFNYALEYLVEQTLHPFRQFADAPLQMSDNPSSVPPAPNLFTALEQQLGLRLEPMQVPRQYIVIDAIKRPDAN